MSLLRTALNHKNLKINHYFYICHADFFKQCMTTKSITKKYWSNELFLTSHKHYWDKDWKFTTNIFIIHHGNSDLSFLRWDSYEQSVVTSCEVDLWDQKKIEDFTCIWLECVRYQVCKLYRIYGCDYKIQHLLQG